MLIDLLKFYLRPSSPLAAVLVFGVGVAWLWWKPSSRGPRRYLLAMILGYWLAATPIGAGLILAGLSRGYSQVQTREEARGAETIVVLGGGAKTFTAGDAVVGVLSHPSLMRALEGARVAKLIGAKLVIASAGKPRPHILLKPESEMLRDVLVQAGVPPGGIVQESTSTTTREQAQMVGLMLRGQGIGRFVLVTSPMHMRRALAVFRNEGLDPVPSLAPIRARHLDRPPLLLPNDESLTIFDEAIYDYAAWVYYWVRGWTHAQPAGSAGPPRSDRQLTGARKR